MKRLKHILLIIIVIVCSFFYSHITKMNLIYDREVDNSEYLSTGIVSAESINQKFNCVEDTLDGINVKCQIWGDVRDINIHYSIQDVQNGQVVAEGVREATSIDSTKFNEFTFDTVEGCKNKEYILSIWMDNATNEDGISFYYEEVTEPYTELVIAGNKTQGTLIMKTMTNRFDFETFFVVLLFCAFIYGFMKMLYKLFK